MAPPLGTPQRSAAPAAWSVFGRHNQRASRRAGGGDLALYIDASALVSLILVERDTAWAEDVILQTGEERLISDFAVAEVASAISRGVRTGERTREAAETLLAAFDVWALADAMPVETTTTDIAEAGRLVRRLELMLRAPDALHLVLARRSGAMLVTRDRAMARAAQRISLPVATPD